MDTLIASVDGGEGRGASTCVLGRYRLLQRLGSGGFGEVWRARDEVLAREVAVKRIPCDSEGFAERAVREAQAAARLSHPAIVALYEAAEQDGAFYLTSELVEGQTLASTIAQDLLRDREILEVGLALCDALAHAHGRGVIHRDVKPQNILIPDEPHERLAVAKLTDFGGARLDGEQALTRTGDVLGTLAYMAPEQSEGLRAGPEADLYSLALVLYEALSGENPVRAGTPAATVRRIGSRLPSLSHARRDLSRELTAAIDRALLPDPQDRGTLSELAHALKQTDAQGASAWRTAEDRVRTAEDPVGSARTSIAPLLAGATPDSPAAGAIPDFPPAAGATPGSARAGVQLPALPRLAWAMAAIALIAWQLAAGRPGLSLLLLAGALPLLIAMPRRASPSWAMPALAPLLGLAGLASAFPALCGHPAPARMRAWLAALGYWWLCLAQVGFTRGMAPAVRFSSGFPSANAGSAWARPDWEHSIAAAAHALAPLLSAATLGGAALWAAGAVALPWLLRGRGVAFDLLLAGGWSAALLVGPSLLAALLHDGTSAAAPPVAILGAVLGALLAVALTQGRRAVWPLHA